MGHGTSDSQAGQPSQPAVVSELALCSSLMQDATVRVEDITGGAAIVIKPRSASDLPVVKQRADQIEQRLSSPSSGTSGAPCELFTIVHGGAAAAVAETPGAIRVLITTSDQGRVRQIRREVRDFVSKSEKAGEKSEKGGRP